jgi:hypothetical protein
MGKTIVRVIEVIRVIFPVWYRPVPNNKDDQHRTTPPEKMALEAIKPEATKDPWVRTGCPGDSAI